MVRAALVVIGVSVGILVGVAAFAVLDDGDPTPPEATSAASNRFPPVSHDPEAAAALVSAWERWRNATFLARGTWERRLDAGGEPLRGPVLTVQDPPRRTVVRLGTLVEVVDDSVRTCDSDPEAALAPPCAVGSGALGYAERTAAEIDLVRGYVEGDGRPFDVAAGDLPGCYRAENRALLPAAPWGLWAEFCFDDATGALISARVRRASAVDSEVVFELRSEVTDEDFGLQ